MKARIRSTLAPPDPPQRPKSRHQESTGHSKKKRRISSTHTKDSASSSASFQGISISTDESVLPDSVVDTEPSGAQAHEPPLTTTTSATTAATVTTLRLLECLFPLSIESTSFDVNGLILQPDANAVTSISSDQHVVTEDLPAEPVLEPDINDCADDYVNNFDGCDYEISTQFLSSASSLSSPQCPTLLLLVPLLDSTNFTVSILNEMTTEMPTEANSESQVLDPAPDVEYIDTESTNEVPVLKVSTVVAVDSACLNNLTLPPSLSPSPVVSLVKPPEPVTLFALAPLTTVVPFSVHDTVECPSDELSAIVDSDSNSHRSESVKATSDVYETVHEDLKEEFITSVIPVIEPAAPPSCHLPLLESCALALAFPIQDILVPFTLFTSDLISRQTSETAELNPSSNTESVVLQEDSVCLNPPSPAPLLSTPTKQNAMLSFESLLPLSNTTVSFALFDEMDCTHIESPISGNSDMSSLGFTCDAEIVKGADEGMTEDVAILVERGLIMFTEEVSIETHSPLDSSFKLVPTSDVSSLESIEASEEVVPTSDLNIDYEQVEADAGTSNTKSDSVDNAVDMVESVPTPSVLLSLFPLPLLDEAFLCPTCLRTPVSMMTSIPSIADAEASPSAASDLNTHICIESEILKDSAPLFDSPSSSNNHILSVVSTPTNNDQAFAQSGVKEQSKDTFDNPICSGYGERSALIPITLDHPPKSILKVKRPATDARDESDAAVNFMQSVSVENVSYQGISTKRVRFDLPAYTSPVKNALSRLRRQNSRLRQGLRKKNSISQSFASHVTSSSSSSSDGAAEVIVSTSAVGVASGIVRQQLMVDFFDCDDKQDEDSTKAAVSTPVEKNDSECDLFTDICSPVCEVREAQTDNRVTDTDNGDDDWMFCDNLLSPPESSFSQPLVSSLLNANLEEEDGFFVEHCF